MAITLSGGRIEISGSSDSGTASSGGANTITDAGKSWVTNNYEFAIVEITAGTGIGQYRVIKSNTTSVLTLTRDWGITPDATSVYVIYYNLKDIVASIVGADYSVSSAVGQSITSIYEIRVLNGGYLGNGHNPTITFTANKVGLQCDLGGHIQFGDTTHDGVNGMYGGVVTSHHSYGTSYNNMLMLGYCRFYSTVFSCVTDFIFDSGTNNERTRYNIGDPITNDLVLLDCCFYTLGLEIASGNTVKRCRFFNTQFGTRGLGSVLTDASENSSYRTTYSFQGAKAQLNVPVYDWESKGVFPLSDRSNKSLFLYQWVSPLYAILFNYVHDDYSDFPERVCYDTFTSNNGVLWFGISASITVNDDVNLPVSGVNIGAFDKNGNDAWVNVYGNPSTYIGSKATDINGVLEGELMIGKVERLSGKIAQWSAGYPVNPWKIRIRKYGYVYLEFIKDWDRRAAESFAVLNNAVISANEASASSITGIVINGVAKTITVNISRSAQELYDYSQWWGGQSSNLTYDEPLLSVDGNNFTLATGWTLLLGVAITGGINLTGNVQQTAVFDFTDHNITGQLTFTTAGTYTITNSDITEVINTSGGAIIVKKINSTITTNTGPNITEQVSAALSLNVTNGSGYEWRIYRLGTSLVYGVELDGQESSPTQVAVYTYTVQETVVVQILKPGFIEFIEEVALGSSNQALNITLKPLENT